MKHYDLRHIMDGTFNCPSFPVVKSYLMIRLFYIKYDRALYSVWQFTTYLSKSLGIVTKLVNPRRFINDSHDFILHCLSPSFLDLLHVNCQQVTPFRIDFWMEKSSRNFKIGRLFHSLKSHLTVFSDYWFKAAFLEKVCYVNFGTYKNPVQLLIYFDPTVVHV